MIISIGQAEWPCIGLIELIFKDCDTAHKKKGKTGYIFSNVLCSVSSNPWFAVLSLVEGICWTRRFILLVNGLIGVSVSRYRRETCRERSNIQHKLPLWKCSIFKHVLWCSSFISAMHCYLTDVIFLRGKTSCKQLLADLVAWVKQLTSSGWIQICWKNFTITFGNNCMNF